MIAENKSVIMTDPPFFSVVIPTYNREKIISKAIESVLSQTYENFELIVVDDGSTDRTKDVVEGYNDSKIRYLWQEATGAPAGPRNRGIDLARGKYVAFLDSDDWWLPEKLQVCFDRIKSFPNTDVVFHDMNSFIDGKEGKVMYCGPLKSPIFHHLLESCRGISLSSSVVRLRKLKEVEGFEEDKNFVAAEDFDLWLKLALIIDDFMYIDQVLGYYNEHSTGISKFEDVQIRNSEYVYRKYLSIYSKDKKKQMRLMGLSYFKSAIAYHRMGRRSEAQKYYIKALLSGRISWEPLAGLVALKIGMNV